MLRIRCIRKKMCHSFSHREGNRYSLLSPTNTRFRREMTGRYSEMWDRWARVWDSMLSLVGYDDAYRGRAVEKLALKGGDSVLDLACGTGLNFKFLEEKIGRQGKIIALDYSRVMLEKAREKIKANNWLNITLVQADASNFSLE